ncbi:MAG: ABC transporter permease subunit [Chloroflexi bacterium]|nr:ABC transporter permease subunit [Chloroflexota bacterium]
MFQRQISWRTLWRDERFLRVFGQIVFLLVVLAVGRYLYINMYRALEQRSLLPDFSFLNTTAGFHIGEVPSFLEYSGESTNKEALIVGLFNTLRVSFWGIIFATIVGVIVGTARVLPNPLARFLATVYVEFLRNVPLLVLLVFWYRGVFIVLPKLTENPIVIGRKVNPDGTWQAWLVLSNRGMAMAWGEPTEAWPAYRLWLVLALVAAVVVYIGLSIYARRTGRAPLTLLWALGAFLAVAAVGWGVVTLTHGQAPLSLSVPYVKRRLVKGGIRFTPEFLALLSGLVLYTGAYIAEVVRAGLQSVSKGQIEAARALGLPTFQTLRFVVFPQALRVIVPPLTSQYLNLTKNSTLAVAIGYPDLFNVAGTIFNQTGRSIEVILIIMGVYLSFSLITSAFMNWYNRKIRIVER